MIWLIEVYYKDKWIPSFQVDCGHYFSTKREARDYQKEYDGKFPTRIVKYSLHTPMTINSYDLGWSD